MSIRKCVLKLLGFGLAQAIGESAKEATGFIKNRMESVGSVGCQLIEMKYS